MPHGWVPEYPTPGGGRETPEGQDGIEAEAAVQETREENKELPPWE